MTLVDVMFPKLGEFELIGCINKRDIYVIFIIAKNSVVDKAKGLRLGGYDYIVKPFYYN